MKARNQALGWLCLCYPAMPPAFICGLQVCSGQQLYLIGLVLFYLLLLYSLVRCTRDLGPAGWAFGCAGLATLVHVVAAMSLVSGRSVGVEDLLMVPIFGVSILVGVGGALLAFGQGRKTLGAGLLATSCLMVTVGSGYRGPLDDPKWFLLAFFAQAILLWNCRQHEATQLDGTGFTQS